ncbi:hypothetical protein Z968_05325 [Clostridium novyi A str. 4552]|uniref:Ig protease IdeS domain-containing protein n=1 Tax=Clostridium novyi A str. 4552 TaxID=1444289 RepID=A0A0A0I8L2_CLONO|nr:IdeS/Mac family cysteine endopeptidase [Clostridium novyi]KGM96913.1 hypothetical protein Z968_05325 [Clostridium novyi A str. 4552]
MTFIKNKKNITIPILLVIVLTWSGIFIHKKSLLKQDEVNNMSKTKNKNSINSKLNLNNLIKDKYVNKKKQNINLIKDYTSKNNEIDITPSPKLAKSSIKLKTKSNNSIDYPLLNHNIYSYKDNSTVVKPSVDNSDKDNSTVVKPSVDNSDKDNSTAVKPSVDNSDKDNSTMVKPSVDNSDKDNSTAVKPSVDNSDKDNSTMVKPSVDNSDKDNSTAVKPSVDNSDKDNSTMVKPYNKKRKHKTRRKFKPVEDSKIKNESENTDSKKLVQKPDSIDKSNKAKNNSSDTNKQEDKSKTKPSIIVKDENKDKSSNSVSTTPKPKVETNKKITEDVKKKETVKKTQEDIKAKESDINVTKKDAQKNDSVSQADKAKNNSSDTNKQEDKSKTKPSIIVKDENKNKSSNSVSTTPKPKVETNKKITEDDTKENVKPTIGTTKKIKSREEQYIEQEFNKLLNANKNIMAIKDESQNTVYDVWTKGITPPSQNEFIPQDYGKDYTVLIAPWKPGKGWYDIDKEKKNSGDENLCSGAVATNMLHWWFDQNKEYIEKYLNESPENGKNLNKTLDVRNICKFHNQKNSEIFNFIKICFPHKSIWSDRAILWYINGYDMFEPLARQNLEKDADKRAGFFNNVFKTTNLSDRSYTGLYEVLNSRIIQWLNEDRMLGISHSTPFYNDHIITLWGARFNENGKLLGIYTSDSDDEDSQMNTKQPFGMRYSFISKDSNGLARISNYNKNNPNIGAKVHSLFSLTLGQDTWNKYFNKN